MSNFAMAMLNDKIWYFSLSGQQYWMLAIITDMRILQSSTNTNYIRFINKRIELRYPALSIQSSGITIFKILPLILTIYILVWNVSAKPVSLMTFLTAESWLWLSVLLLLYLMLSFFFALSWSSISLQTASSVKQSWPFLTKLKHDFPELTKLLFAQLSDSHAQPFLALDLLDWCLGSWC